MNIEEYFDFLAPDDIRIRGHRIGIEDVLYEYLHGSMTVEELSQRFPTLTLEEIHACILYYLHNKGEVDSYLTAWLDRHERRLAEQAASHSLALVRVREARTARFQQQVTAPSAIR